MKLTPSLETRFQRVASLSFVLVSFLSGAVLIAWRLGTPREGVLNMAPSALVMLLAFSLAAWLCQRPSQSAIANRLGWLIGIGAMALSLLGCAQFVYGYEWGADEWLAQVLGTSEDIPQARLSNTAAFSFLLAGVAWLVQCPLFRRLRALRQVAAILALALLMAGGVMLLCYLLQATYYAQTAFLAAVGWFFLGLGLLITAGLDNWPLNLCFLPEDETRSGQRFAWGIASLVLLLTVIVVALGEFYYLSQQIGVRRTAWQALATVADLKAAQVGDWQHERLADARFLQRTPYVAGRALDAVERGRKGKTRQIFRSWLTYLFADKPYERVLLLDEELNVQMVHPDGPVGDLSDALRRAAGAALQQKEVVVADLQREAETQNVQWALAVPMLDRREIDEAGSRATGTNATRTLHRRGVLMLRIDARKTLFPMLRRWPMRSPTAEALLLRREGNDVVILNDLRHGTNAPLTVRLPLDNRTVEVRSARFEGIGSTGQISGLDYRRVPIIGVWRKIPNSPWVILIKVDEKEVYAPVLRQAWTTAGLVGLLIGVAILGVALLGRQRNLIATQRELLMERRQRESEMMFRTLAQVSPVGIFRTNAAGNCLYVNDRWCEITGLSAETAQEKGWRQTVHPDDRARVYAMWQQAAVEHSPLSLEFRFQRPDGKITWVLAQEAPLPGLAGGPAGRIGTITDITASKQAEVALLEISDREQVRIGQDLHDGLCQDLVVIGFAIEAIEQKLARGTLPGKSEIEKITTMLSEIIGRTRNMARGLFPVEMEAEGLANSLQSLVDQTSGRYGLRCELDYPLPVSIQDITIATQLYRIAQEAVTNAVKHAQPKRIELRLARNLGQIELTVLDDGVGIPIALPSNGGMGLSIMEYRAKTIGATLKIQRRERGGTEVSCYVTDEPSVQPPGNDETGA